MEVKEIAEKLKAYFPEEDIQWRITATTQDKTKGFAVPYIDTRAIQRRLDDTGGVDDWKVSSAESMSSYDNNPSTNFIMVPVYSHNKYKVLSISSDVL